MTFREFRKLPDKGISAVSALFTHVDVPEGPEPVRTRSFFFISDHISGEVASIQTSSRSDIFFRVPGRQDEYILTVNALDEEIEMVRLHQMLLDEAPGRRGHPKFRGVEFALFMSAIFGALVALGYQEYTSNRSVYAVPSAAVMMQQVPNEPKKSAVIDAKAPEEAGVRTIELDGYQEAAVPITLKPKGGHTEKAQEETPPASKQGDEGAENSLEILRLFKESEGAAAGDMPSTKEGRPREAEQSDNLRRLVNAAKNEYGIPDIPSSEGTLTLEASPRTISAPGGGNLEDVEDIKDFGLSPD